VEELMFQRHQLFRNSRLRLHRQGNRKFIAEEFSNPNLETWGFILI
jgi:hypothetical protein